MYLVQQTSAVGTRLTQKRDRNIEARGRQRKTEGKFQPRRIRPQAGIEVIRSGKLRGKGAMVTSSNGTMAAMVVSSVGCTSNNSELYMPTARCAESTSEGGMMSLKRRSKSVRP